MHVWGATRLLPARRALIFAAAGGSDARGDARPPRRDAAAARRYSWHTAPLRGQGAGRGARQCCDAPCVLAWTRRVCSSTELQHALAPLRSGRRYWPRGRQAPGCRRAGMCYQLHLAVVSALHHIGETNIKQARHEQSAVTWQTLQRQFVPYLCADECRE